MSVIRNEVRRTTYLDSIVLMRMSREIAALAGVEEAGLITGTPANKEILREAGILAAEGEKAEAGDLIRLSKSPYELPLAMAPGMSFFEVLRQKLKWSGTAI